MADQPQNGNPVQNPAPPQPPNPNPVPNPPPVAQQMANPPPPQQPPAPVSALAQLARTMTVGPNPSLARVNLAIDIGANPPAATAFTEYCSSLYDYLDEIFTVRFAGIALPIGQAQFVRMARTLVIYRVQQVREIRLGHRAAANRVVIPRAFPVPQGLLEIYSGLGEIFLSRRGYFIIPQLPAIPDPIPDYYTVDGAITQAWILFLDLLNRNGLHRSAPMPTDPLGTPYWILHRAVANNLVTVTGITDEASPADGFLRAMIDISAGAANELAHFNYTSGLHFAVLRQMYWSMC